MDVRDLILVGDIEDYEKKLVEEWDIRFETMKENLGDKPSEERKIESARTMYDWIEKEADIPIRPRCQETLLHVDHIIFYLIDVKWAGM